MILKILLWGLKKMAKTSNYIPMDSPIDRMNPMVKIYAIFCLGLSALIYPGFILGYIIVAGLFVVAALAGLLKKFSKFIFMFLSLFCDADVYTGPVQSEKRDHYR